MTTKDPFKQQLFMAVVSGLIARGDHDDSIYDYADHLTNLICRDHLKDNEHVRKG